MTSAVLSVGKKPVSRHEGLCGRYSCDGFLDGSVDSEKRRGEGDVVGWAGGSHCARMDVDVG